MRVGRGETSLGELFPGNCRLSDARPLKGKAITDPRPVCVPFCLLRALPAAWESQQLVTTLNCKASVPKVGTSLNPEINNVRRNRPSWLPTLLGQGKSTKSMTARVTSSPRPAMICAVHLPLEVATQRTQVNTQAFSQRPERKPWRKHPPLLRRRL